MKLKYFCFLLVFGFGSSHLWGDEPDLLSQNDKKVLADHSRAIKQSGAHLQLNGTLKIFGHDLKPRDAADFSFDNDQDKKEAEKDLESFTETNVDLSTSPNGRWTVIYLTDLGEGHDFWLYDHQTKAEPLHFTGKFGRFNEIFWLGNSLFRVQEECSMVCSSNQFFKPEDVLHPSGQIDDFFIYDPNRDLYIGDYGNGIEVGHPFAQAQAMFEIKDGFRENVEGMDPGGKDNVDEKGVTATFEGKKVIIDYQTEGGEKVHREFTLNF